MEQAIRERSIIFSCDEVKAILDGSKTQTRRVIPLKDGKYRFNPARFMLDPADGIVDREVLEVEGKYGYRGDRLWVRETFNIRNSYDAPKDTELRKKYLYFRADFNKELGDCKSWLASVQMPRWASRINLEITDVRVESLQGISVSDCLQEGAEIVTYASETQSPHEIRIMWLENFWNSSNPKHPWQSNPWVWAITFKRIK